MKNLEQSFNQELVPRDRFLGFMQAEDGLTGTEYAVAIGLIAASTAATFGVFGDLTDAVIGAVTSFF